MAKSKTNKAPKNKSLTELSILEDKANEIANKKIDFVKRWKKSKNKNSTYIEVAADLRDQEVTILKELKADLMTKLSEIDTRIGKPVELSKKDKKMADDFKKSTDLIQDALSKMGVGKIQWTDFAGKKITK